jgi:hypothetical protein
MNLSSLCAKTISDIASTNVKKVHVLLTGDISDALVCYLLQQCDLVVCGHVITWFQSEADELIANDVQAVLTDTGESISTKLQVINLLSKLDMLNDQEEVEPQEILHAHRVAKRLSMLYVSGLCKDGEIIVSTMDRTRRVLGLSIPEDELHYNPLKSLLRNEVYQLVSEMLSSISDSLVMTKSLFDKLVRSPSYEDKIMLNLIFKPEQRSLHFRELLNSLDNYVLQALSKKETHSKIITLVAERMTGMKVRSL